MGRDTNWGFSPGFTPEFAKLSPCQGPCSSQGSVPANCHPGTVLEEEKGIKELSARWLKHKAGFRAGQPPENRDLHFEAGTRPFWSWDSPSFEPGTPLEPPHSSRLSQASPRCATGRPGSTRAGFLYLLPVPAGPDRPTEGSREPGKGLREA